MSIDIIPSGFSSAATSTLLKTMKSSEKAISLSIATRSSVVVDTSLKATMSSNALFTILAAAATSQNATSASPTNKAAAVAGAQAYVADPYLQHDYTLEQAGQNYYAFQSMVADALRNTSGATNPGQSAGEIIAAQSGFTGDQGASFAKAFDNRTLTFSDPSTAGIGAKVTDYYSTNGSGIATGRGSTVSVNGTAWDAYQASHPDAIWSSDYGYKGSAGLFISW